MLYALLSVAAVASLLGVGEGAKKTWIPNTNFGSSTSWSTGRVPCSKDRVIIPHNAVVSLFVQQLVQVREIILPLNGELILPIRGELDVGIPKPLENCEGEDVTFVATNSRAWYNPDNWEITASVGGLVTKSKTAVPVPHSEFIPCPFDNVVFPPNSSFSVHVEGHSVKVGTFEINGKNLDPDGLHDFLASSTGLRQFRVDGLLSVYPAGRLCADLAGCSCGNDDPDFMKRICVHATRFGCPVPQCIDPITPVGSCCAICGTTVTVTVDEYFQFDPLKAMYMTFLLQTGFESVSGYMFKTHNGRVQAIFTDDSPVHRSEKLGEEILKILKQKFQRERLNVHAFSIETTTDWSHPSAAFYSHSGMSAGGWVAIIFGLFSIAIIAFLYIVQRSHLIFRRPLAFSFGRFENEFDRDQRRDSAFEQGVELTQQVSRNVATTAPTSTLVSSKSDEVKGFDNPYYDDTCKDVKSSTGVSPIGKSYESQHTRQNPCYMAYERVEDIPETTDNK